MRIISATKSDFDITKEITLLIIATENHDCLCYDVMEKGIDKKTLC